MNRTKLIAIVLLLAPRLASAAPTPGTWNFKAAKQAYGVYDPSTFPAVNLLDFQFELVGASFGTPPAPFDPLTATTIPAVLNPDPLGFGDAWKGSTHSDESPKESICFSYDFHVKTTDPGTDGLTAMTTGVVKFFNNAKGFEFRTRTQFPGGAPVVLTYTGTIDPARTDLTFVGVDLASLNPLDPQAASAFDMLIELQSVGPKPSGPNLPVFDVVVTAAVVPEPATLLLAVAGVIFASARRRQVGVFA